MNTELLYEQGSHLSDTRGYVYEIIVGTENDGTWVVMYYGETKGSEIFCDDPTLWHKLPPLPDVEALKKQGYRLTGMAADCSADESQKRFVLCDSSQVATAACFSQADKYNGWRWIVERIDFELEASEARIQQATTDFGTATDEYDRGYQAGYQAARDNAIRILSSNKENSYEA
jgi:hypothetical protein